MAVFEFNGHVVDIFRKSTLGNDWWCARCSCGWLKYGTRAEVTNAAGIHDLELHQGPTCVGRS
jgi:hypothetical protein